MPYAWYYIPVVLIAMIGFFDACYLAVSHYRVYTDMEYQSFCAISRAFNCDTVSQSPYSILIGVPVPVWGIIGYAVVILLLLFARPQLVSGKRIWTLVFLISLGFSIYSMVLALISTFWIDSYCIMCILSYAVNLLLLYFSWLIRKRFQVEPLLSAVKLDVEHLLPRSKRSLGFLVCCVSILLAGLAALPSYWRLKPPELSQEIPTGTTAEGFPWCGAEHPKLVITEFADYRCFQCKKMHFFLRNLIQKNPDKIRLIHRHFPMDQKINPIVREPFHEGAGLLSMIAIAAARDGKFWPMNDRLFELARERQEMDTKMLARDIGMDPKSLVDALLDPRTKAHLSRDIQDGIRLGISGTPAYLVEGNLYLGWLPGNVLARVME